MTGIHRQALALLLAAAWNPAAQGFVISSPHSSSSSALHMSAPPEAPSLAQTHNQGPLTVNGSGQAMTKEQLEEAREELDKIKKEFGFKEPERSFMDDPDIQWRFGGKPDYTVTNLLFLKERSKIHPEGSLELIVENLVKTWEMERSHKTDPNQHQSVDTEKFQITANGGKTYNNIEANKVGNYNVLLDSVAPDVWDNDKITWEDSHDTFHETFAAFPWEVLEVFSGPPKVGFTWRHWGTFTGEFEGNKGQGELVEMFGFGTAVVNDKLQLQDVEIFFNAEEFIDVLRGNKKNHRSQYHVDSKQPWVSIHGSQRKPGG
uniref:Pathogen-related protein n=1 Tax=Entomoneis paludosa TaxID=265537 RepID=A0A7S2YSQ3_9STRA|mmetsp:Transcript_8330/g.17352  ORF Transcript_8330/g.17352 Transcript_8330/m.17352 type:complete len:318 (+) Transcript_8330:343-1296(+)